MKHWFWNLLIAVDQGCNVLFGPLLNRILKPRRSKFGYPDETLSSVFGKGIRNGDCRLCKYICRWLNKLDNNHCQRSVEEDEGSGAD